MLRQAMNGTRLQRSVDMIVLETLHNPIHHGGHVPQPTVSFRNNLVQQVRETVVYDNGLTFASSINVKRIRPVAHDTHLLRVEIPTQFPYLDLEPMSDDLGTLRFVELEVGELVAERVLGSDSWRHVHGKSAEFPFDYFLAEVRLRQRQPDLDNLCVVGRRDDYREIHVVSNRIKSSRLVRHLRIKGNCLGGKSFWIQHDHGEQ